LVVPLGETKYEITSKADIYPYGLTLHEMITLKAPHLDTAQEDTSTNNTSTNDNEFDMELQRNLGNYPGLCSH
jgi:hypothetical protein